MSIPEFSVRNSVLVNMLMLLTLIGGVIFALTLVKEMFPEIRPNRISISAVYRGVQPAEMEKAITIKVEEAVRDVEGVEKVSSTVSEGISSTVVTLLQEVDDTDAAMQLIKNRVDALEDLPDDLDKITVDKMEPKLPVIIVAMFGDGSETELKQAARDLRDELLRLPGVSEIELGGTRDDEISIEVRPEKLIEYDVTFDEVADAISRTNLDVSGGQLEGVRTRTAVRTLGERTRGRDLEDLVVRTELDGRKIYLRDVAKIIDGFIDSDLESYFNGRRAANCTVYKTKSQDAIQISRLVKAYVAGQMDQPFDPYGFAKAAEAAWYAKPVAYFTALSDYLVIKIGGLPDPGEVYEQSRRNPPRHGFDLALHNDLARFVEGRLDLLTRNGLQGLVLVVISLNLFLNWRVAFWAAIGLPVSFLGTFIVMWLFGVSINLLSMFGLIIVLGIIVDDAIVIGENIYRHVEEGMPAMRAAVVGAEEVMWPVITAVTTTVAAFAPLFAIGGQIGTFMGQLPLVVIAALSVSLVEAIIILPSHLSHFPDKQEIERQRIKRRQWWVTRKLDALQDARDRFIQNVLMTSYERLLRFALRWRYVTVATCMATVVATCGLVAGEIVPFVFVQKMDSESLICELELPVGTPSDRVRRVTDRISEFAKEQPEVVNIQAYVGEIYDIGGAGATGVSQQSHRGQLIIELMAADQRDRAGGRSSEGVLVEFREFSRQLKGINSIKWSAMSGGPGGNDIEINVTGPDFAENVLVADQLKQELAQFEGTYDLDDNHDEGKREVRLRLRDSARSTGITTADLGSHVRSATFGREALRVTRNREDVRIMVRYPERFREDISNIETMYLPSPGGSGMRSWVPLPAVAEVTMSESDTVIHRADQQRSVTVTGSVNDEVAKSSEILAAVAEEFDETMRPDHPSVRLEFRGKMEEQGKAFAGLRVAGPVALLSIYMLLAGLFRSYVQPLVVMTAIPFGIEGAILGHWITGNPLTILSCIGLVALSGILVNDSLVLVDFINARVRAGLSPFEASVQGAKLRLRAILLTTLTTAAGLTPLMFETSFQAKFLIPMAVTLTYGLIFATALTLIIVPAMNMIAEDLFGGMMASGEVEDVGAQQEKPVAV
ncbi:efflux RND transporter permease subunit [Stratiformator vulcanicus]|uniref:Putative efflux pump membrane transporter TtgB n=1 Tax=Stratiformator vulcanicus TaxID=2527980 RepID=A0A517QZG2_9PLAN|nr:efflux RND transporter permease subunit [Stratiformator vulcanicus]QDT37037.1 putative efflux pump membrane transporter TtgB [Stratiformator vulcanicus]